MPIRILIAAAIRRIVDKAAELVLGSAAFAAITSQPGDDIRVLLGHDGRPSTRTMARPVDRRPPVRAVATRASSPSQALH